MDADNRGVAHGLGTVDRVAHDVAIILLPDPALRRHVRAGHQLQQHFPVIFGFRIFRDVERRALLWLGPWPVIVRRIFGERRDRDIAHHLTKLFQHHVAGIGRHADDFGVEVVLVEDGLGDPFLAGFQHHEHPLLALGQHDLIGGHAGLALGHLVEVHLDADAALVCHLDGGRRQPGCAHILNRLDRIGRHQLKTRLDQQLLCEWVTDLHGGALFLVTFGEFRRRHGRAVDAVPAGL